MNKIAGEDGSLKWALKSRRKGNNVEAAIAQHKKSLKEILGIYGKGPAARRRHEIGHTIENYKQFVSLIECMLKYDPKQRISPLEALNHPFMKMNESTSGQRTSLYNSFETKLRYKYKSSSSRKMVRRPGSGE